MAHLLIEKCGLLFWPQLFLNIAASTLVVAYLLAWKRGEILPGERPWQAALEPLAGLAVTLGLFGSVWGFIEAFGGFQEGMNVSALVKGLSLAYWTTGVGIATSLIATLGSYLLDMLIRNR